jgi:glycosyltransferase involved in cell wall biosynthesis
VQPPVATKPAGSGSCEKQYALAVVALHPIQYQAGLWRAIAQHPRLRLHVLFLDTVGIDGSVDPTMGAPMKWDLPLLDGYSSEFVRNLSPFRFTPIVHRLNPAIGRRLAAAPYDAVVLHGYLTLSNWLALRAARRLGLKVVYRGEGSLRGGDRHDSPPVNALKRPVNAWFLRHCDAIAYSSLDNRAYQLERGAPAERLFPMPCSVDNDELEAMRARAAAPEAVRERLRLPAGASLVVSVGRFTENKRTRDLVAALAEPPLRGRPEVHLLLVGDGPLRRELEAQAAAAGLAGRVHFAGFLNQPEVVEALLASDVFALGSSHGDPSPKALSEALYLGRPVVCSEGVGTCRDLVEDGRNGFVVPTGDTAALARRLAEVLDHPRRGELGRRSHELGRAWDFHAGVEALVQRLDLLLRAAPGA